MESQSPQIKSAQFIVNLVNKGLKHHKTQAWALARSCYEQVLACDSHHADALHLLGMLHAEEGDILAAMRLISDAIKVNPVCEIYHNNLGNVYFASGEFREAEKCFDAALVLKPDYVEARFNMANAQYEQKNTLAAEENYRRVLSIDPQFIPALYNLTDILLRKTEYALAYDILKNSDVVKSDGDLMQRYIEVMSLYSDQTEEKAIRQELLTSIVHFDPDNIGARYNLANIYKENGDLIEAEKYYQQILKLDSRYFGALVNSGVIDTWCARFDTALKKFNAALLVNDNDYTLLNNLGLAYQAIKDCEKSKYYYEKALSVDRTRPEAYWNYALLLLLTGEYEKGWEYYEYRWEIADQLLAEKRDYGKPLWRGESLRNKVLFVYCEQGYGDSLQFFRYVLKLIENDWRVILESPKSLARLFKVTSAKLVIVTPGEELPYFDYQIPMMSLPYAFSTRLSSIPFDVPYLKTIFKDVALWRDKLYMANRGQGGDTSKIIDREVIKVGVVWAGNPRKADQVNHLIDQRRSCQLSVFSTLFEFNNEQGLQFFSLQKDSVDEVKIDNLNTCMENVTDFYDTACLIQNLDLVISVDTAVAHLAAALGKPVWLLSRYDGCWRWLLNREDSPWYPTLRIFRQDKPGDWAGVLANVKNALREFSKDSISTRKAIAFFQ